MRGHVGDPARWIDWKPRVKRTRNTSKPGAKPAKKLPGWLPDVLTAPSGSKKHSGKPQAQAQARGRTKSHDPHAEREADRY